MALAVPPLSPPLRPLSCFLLGAGTLVSPVARCTTSKATCVKSFFVAI